MLLPQAVISIFHQRFPALKHQMGQPVVIQAFLAFAKQLSLPSSSNSFLNLQMAVRFALENYRCSDWERW